MKTKMRSARRLQFWGILTLSILMAFTAGCGGTHQARRVKTSGFLEDYSMLQKGEGKEALLIYVNTDADFDEYTKVMMDPIKVYPGVGDSLFRKMSDEDLQKLVNYFDAAIRTELEGDYEFVEKPGVGVMRFRIALTEADASKVAMDTVSSVVPFGIALNGLQTVATGAGSGVGDSSMEFEALDSLTGERLAAAVDKRIGNKYTGNFDKFDRWHAVKAAFDTWAKRLDARLEELRN